MESFFLGLGLSWTWSKLLPYLLMIIIGILLFRFVFKRVEGKGWKLLSTLIIFIPFLAYFAFVPIYQGDFTDNSTVTKRTAKHTELTGKKLVVIAIPGCPYCSSAMESMVNLKAKNPNLQIEYIVLSTDSEALVPYKKLSNGKIDVVLAENIDAMQAIAQGSYPSFVIVDGKKPLKRWSNNDFGVVALDQVEDLAN